MILLRKSCQIDYNVINTEISLFMKNWQIFKQIII